MASLELLSIKPFWRNLHKNKWQKNENDRDLCQRLLWICKRRGLARGIYARDDSGLGRSTTFARIFQNFPFQSKDFLVSRGEGFPRKLIYFATEEGSIAGTSPQSSNTRPQTHKSDGLSPKVSHVQHSNSSAQFMTQFSDLNFNKLAPNKLSCRN